MNEEIEKIPGIRIVVVDDIIIFGKGEINKEAMQDYNENLLKLLRLQDKIKFR